MPISIGYIAVPIDLICDAEESLCGFGAPTASSVNVTVAEYDCCVERLAAIRNFTVPALVVPPSNGVVTVTSLHVADHVNELLPVSYT